jgi:predicted CXXCH cytochrome family protein
MPKSVWTHRVIPAVTAVFAIAWLAACTETVYKERPPFKDPPDPASGFLGYYDDATQQTTCGNCHVETQADWKGTAHARAWADLTALGMPDVSSCQGCHTVSENGNMTPGPAGYNAKQDAAYQDVQCESCHGPGITHVEAPDAGTAPLASIHVDTTLANAGVGACSACHQDTHHPQWEEWRQSMHARMGRHNDEELCLQCHTGAGALEAWGIETSFKEMNDPLPVDGITCAVCHDPHDNTNPGQLRYPLASSDPNTQLCMKCHNRRSVPIAMDSTRSSPEGQSGSNSPHGPQGPVLLATAGYQNPSSLDPAVLSPSTHGSITANPTLCAGCHVYGFPATDDAGNAVTATGHLFRPIPCYVPGSSVPTDTIRSCAYTTAERSFKSCAQAGCHGDEGTAAQLLAVVRGRIQPLTAALWVNNGTGSGSSTSNIDTLDAGIIPFILKATYANRGTISNLSLQVKTAASLGDTVITLYTTSATVLSGKLAPGNTFKIAGDGTTYTVQNTVSAVAQALDTVRISPALAVAAAVNAKATVYLLGPLYANDRVVTPVDGAEWNVRAFGEDANGVFMPGGNGTPASTTDRSHTVHNPFFAEAMLRANIQELTDLYGSLPGFPAPPPAVKAIMAGKLGGKGSSLKGQARVTSSR